MANNFVSPGVYTIEKDISDYTPSINTSIVGIVGFASKGPVNKATLITDQNNLIKTFGPPSEFIPGQALEGALEILEETNSVYFIRSALDTAVEASAIIPIGSCPAFIVSGSTNLTEGFGVGRPLTLRIQVFDNLGLPKYTDNGGAGKDFVIAAGTATSQAEALRKIIGGGLDTNHVGVFDQGSLTTGLGLSGAVVGSYAGQSAYLSVSACSGTTFNPALGVSALRAVNQLIGDNATFGLSGNFASALKVYGSTISTSSVSGAHYLIQSLYPGAGYNGGTKSDGTTSGNSITIENLGNFNFITQVNEDGTTLENFKVAFVGSGAFIEEVINTSLDNATSRIIKGNLYKNGADAVATKLNNFTDTLGTLLNATQFSAASNFLDPITSPNGAGTAITTTGTLTNGPRFIKLIQGTYNLLSGTNIGAVDSAVTENDRAVALIGNATDDVKTGMQALDDPDLNVSIALVPGIHTQSVQNALITLAETTQNFLAVLSPPYAIGTAQDAIDWTNGKSSSTAGSRTSPINSSYAAVYWPWVKVFSVFDGKDRYYDPAIFAARQMAFTDGVSESWFAPAGFVRGRLTKPTEVEVKLNQGDRDSLYSGGNVVNPIVSFSQQGITIFGQRTTQRTPTALDRINIRRLLIFLRKIILQSTQRFVFEPNDEFTWAQIEGVLNPFLDDIRRRRGVSEFRVVCDSTVNTPERVDRNELWTKVLIRPTKTAEVLVFEINLTNQTAQLGSL